MARRYGGSRMKLVGRIAVTLAVAGLAACAPKPPAPTPTPPPTPAPPVASIPPRPLTPGNAASTQVLPGRGVDGRFVTINSNITGDRAFWQLKIGLNVAAIGCRGPEETSLVSAYNQIIKSHGKAIRSTEKTVISELGKETRTSGVAARDRLSTQLFNYFAQPPAQIEFCRTANEVAQALSTTPASQAVASAPAHLARLDEAFVHFYEAYAQYLIDVAAWDARYGQRPISLAPSDSTAPAASIGSAN